MSEFHPPDDYELEPELRAPLPRPVPDALRHHSTRLRKQAVRRGWLGLLVGLSAAAWLGRETAPMKLLGLYSPPFEYTTWIAPVTALLGVWGLTSWARPGKADPYAYLRHGVPLVGRVVDLRSEVTTRVNGRDAAFAYDIYFEYADPSSGEHVARRFRSAQADPSSTRLTCRVGDWLTALYLPGRPDSVMLYGLTGINPDAELVQRPPADRRKQALAGLALMAALVLIASLAKYPPVGEMPNAAWIFIAASALVGLGLGQRSFQRATLRLAQARQQASDQGWVQPGLEHRRPTRWRHLLCGVAGGPFLAMATFFAVNGGLDFGRAQVQAVEFEGLYRTNYNYLFSTYTAKFRNPSDGKIRELGISPLDLVDDRPKSLNLVTHPGALGFPWQELQVEVAESP